MTHKSGKHLLPLNRLKMSFPGCIPTQTVMLTGRCVGLSHSYHPKLKITSDSQNLKSQTTSPAKMFLSAFSNMCTNILLMITGKFPWDLSFLGYLNINTWLKKNPQPLVKKSSALGYVLTSLTLYCCVVLI